MGVVGQEEHGAVWGTLLKPIMSMSRAYVGPSRKNFSDSRIEPSYFPPVTFEVDADKKIDRSPRFGKVS
jgi:hypothetical protein